MPFYACVTTITTMLTKEKINHYKEILERDKEKLLKEIAIDESMTDFGDGAADPEGEEADEAEEQGNVLAVKRVLKTRIEQIDRALEKIKNGAYGKCEQCGMDISEKILDVAPESNLCEHCKKS